jgi:LuxR family maltose regulon positive regulatory protein
VRVFVDEGESMRLLIEKLSRNRDHPLSEYVDKLMIAFAQLGEKEPKVGGLKSEVVESLSQRELEILRLIAEGLSNQEIGRRLFLELDTVKGHNRRIFDKLQVKRRTEAIVRARELDLL